MTLRNIENKADILSHERQTVGCQSPWNWAISTRPGWIVPVDQRLEAAINNIELVWTIRLKRHTEWRPNAHGSPLVATQSDTRGCYGVCD